MANVTTTLSSVLSLIDTTANSAITAVSTVNTVVNEGAKSLDVWVQDRNIERELTREDNLNLRIRRKVVSINEEHIKIDVKLASNKVLNDRVELAMKEKEIQLSELLKTLDK